MAASGDVTTLLHKHCFDCHDADSEKGDIRLDHLGSLDLATRLDLLNKTQEQIYFGQMPPTEKKQPTEAERQQLLDWLGAALREHGASKLEDKLKRPEFGNYVDHEDLFSGEHADLPGYTHDRRWLISEFIFNAKFQRILENATTAKRQGKRVNVVGSHKFRNFSLTNPFLLPNRSGVRYYANEDLTGGHLSSMLTNAQKASEYMTDYLVPRKNGNYLPAIVEIMALEDE
ncbi:MAG: c-type cytochrome domain-containing protein, partial [Verrucomicrobiota bacterium]